MKKIIYLITTIILISLANAIIPELNIQQTENYLTAMLIIDNTQETEAYEESIIITVNTPGIGVSAVENYVYVPAGETSQIPLYNYPIDKHSITGDFSISATSETIHIYETTHVIGAYDPLNIYLETCFADRCNVQVGILGETLSFISKHPENAKASFTLLYPDGVEKKLVKGQIIKTRLSGIYLLKAKYTGERYKTITREITLHVLSEEPVIKLFVSNCGNNICDIDETKDNCPYDCLQKKVTDITQKTTKESKEQTQRTFITENQPQEKNKAFKKLLIILGIVIIIMIIIFTTIKKSEK